MLGITPNQDIVDLFNKLITMWLPIVWGVAGSMIVIYVIYHVLVIMLTHEEEIKARHIKSLISSIKWFAILIGLLMGIHIIFTIVWSMLK